VRSRLMAGVAALVLAITGLLVVSSPASAHCGGHTPHPDLYSSGGVSFRDGTRMRAYPHTNCAIRGLGYPNHRIDLHCATFTSGPGRPAEWFYVRNTTTGVNGWARRDTLRFTSTDLILGCNQGGTSTQPG